MAIVFIPTPLRKFTDNTSQISIEAKSISELLENLSTEYPELKKYIFTSEGKIPAFINIFLNEDDIRNLEDLETEVNENSVISIVPAIAGGIDIPDLTKEELSRYHRHILIPGFGINCQIKLKKAKVLVIGSGGLGCPLLLYLAASGVGTIGIVDFDIVEDSNLQRQVLFGTDDIGQPKVEAAKRRLEKINPLIQINVYKVKLTSQNALSILADYDLVADGTDNFPTRYLVNDACVLLNKPNVYGSIFQFEGQVSVFNYTDSNGVLGPNYRDLYESPPPPGLVPSCSESGVLGVLPGIIGSLQAIEVIKVITGIGETLSGKFYTFDALTFQSRTFNLKRKTSNPLNGNNPSIAGLIDYEEFCSSKDVEKKIKEITSLQLLIMQKEGEDFQIIDVREPFEYDIVNIGGELFPLGNILENAQKISKNKKVVIHCKGGSRSRNAILELEEKFGFQNLYNLKGGIQQYLLDLETKKDTY